ncbi:MAG: glutamate racemase [Flavobacteriales bacterium]|nr:glutamate racemase [Flavobacteriales bacterium]
MSKNNSIGIFDSGVGGLTVAHAIAKSLPNENLVYFGDTLHLPYGEKSAESIQRYAAQIADFLMAQGCKIIVIACNSASATAYDSTKIHIQNKLPVINVIDPMVEHIANHFNGKNVGVVGTKATIKSKVYENKLVGISNIIGKATPLLAPMIEEGFIQDQVSRAVITSYMNDAKLSELQAMVLGCTHYPLIKKDFEHLLGGKVVVLDSSEIVAQAVKAQLEALSLMSDSQLPGTQKFFISDYTDSFKSMAAKFFGETIELEERHLG